MNGTSIERPPAGTNCRVCQCCAAGIYDVSDGVKVRVRDLGESEAPHGIPICMACFNDVPCAGEIAKTVNAVKTEVAAVAPSEPKVEVAMALFQCVCGCGAEVVKDGGCVRGHWQRLPGAAEKMAAAKAAKAQGKGKAKKKPHTALAKVEPVVEVDAPAEEQEESVALELTASQVERIWQSLPIEEKGLGLLTALSAERG